MKDNLLDGHRGKVAVSDTTRNLAQQSGSGPSNTTGGGKCDLKTQSTAPAVIVGGGSNNDGTTGTNFDDADNEWELGIGDLIIDLDADIEKTNERNSGVSNPQPVASSQPQSHHHSHNHGHLQNGNISVPANPIASSSIVSSSIITSPTANSSASFSFLGSQSPCSNNSGVAMSNSKSSRTVSSAGSSGATSTSASSSGMCVVVSGVNNIGNSNSSAVGQSVTGAVEHQATVDKGLKMKIKRKTVGNKYSEAKHEIVQSDTKTAVVLNENNSVNSTVNCSSGPMPNASGVCTETPKSKHSSGKGRNNSHREKKEKNRDKEKGTNSKQSPTEINGVVGVMSPALKITNSGVSLSNPTAMPVSSTVSPSATSLLQNINTTVPTTNSVGPVSAPSASFCNTVTTTNCNSGESVQQPNFATSTPQAISSSSSPPMPNLTLKLENKFSPTTPCSVVVKQEERAESPPLKRVKLELTEDEVDGSVSPIPPEMKDTSTCTSVGTITEPDCLGPCEPGTSVMLEGIVWQETEGGVLVVNVTWRGKTYVGTLLDCTKHDWAPPRFCESPTSDVDAKATKGRGKRGRGANNSGSEVSAFDGRNCVQSKLRNGKGRRTTINSSNFTVPSSPAKTDVAASANGKRKGRPADLEISQPPVVENKTPKRSRLQSRGTPTPSSFSNSEFPHPSSPVLIECPEPNCNKKYKHINGLRYHQQHAHSGSSDGNKLDDNTTEDSKDVTNSSDNEESTPENISVPASPAMSFTNSVSPHPGSGRALSVENNASSSNVPLSLPETDPYNLTPDLTTLASVAINDSKCMQKGSGSNSTVPNSIHTSVSQELPVIVSVEGARNSTPSVLQSTSPCSSVPVSIPSAGTVPDVHSPGVPVVAATNSVIHSSGSAMDTSVVVPPPSVTVSIPTSHVVFNQGVTAAVTCVTTTVHATTAAVSCHGSTASLQSPCASLSTVSVPSYVPVVTTVSSVSVSSPSVIPAVVDKSKSKQPTDRVDKYKPKSPLPVSGIRPIVPAPSSQLIALSSNIPTSHTGASVAHHSLVTSSLKPIQPKPTILGEPTTINPALESLKKEKSKHKKKNKDKERERKPGAVPLPSSVKLSTNPNECSPVEMNPYPSLETVAGNRDPLNAGVSLPGSQHSTISSLEGRKTPSALDINLTGDDNINENIQSPAYSDISDANDTAPVLESEVPSSKEKDDKIGKSTPDAPQSPATNISAYGMYPYYSQPPYLLPSVSPQSSAPGNQVPLMDKQEHNKKMEQERVKENRPWSNPAGELRERPSSENETIDKKPLRENNTPNSSVISSTSAVPNASLQEYHQMQQHQQQYPYAYGYVQGYPYSVEPAYHMHLLDSDPHYKQQYKQYIEEQQRLYKEQQQQSHHHQQQQHSSHHQQQQQHHHSQHQSHHQNKIHHSSSALKEERDRSREHKDRLSMDKLSSSGSHNEHMSKIQHSSMSLVSNKDHDIREQDGRPPSLPTQVRSDSSTPSSASATLKEKQNENHQILKENIELKSQMDDNKNKINQFEMAMLYERHREDMRRYYMLQERIIEQQQQKMEPGFHHHTHHHQTIQTHQLPSHSLSSLKPHKDDMQSSIPSHSKPNHYEGSRSSAVMSPAKSEHIKSASSHPHSSSPKGSNNIRDSSVSAAKEYSSSSGRDSSSSKKDGGASAKTSDRSESSGRDEKVKSDKIKTEPKSEPEGQKPTMETTGPPPPPTNAYAYLHPSYLQPPPPHFPHMPFEPAHAVYRGGLNPMIMSAPSYGSSPYMHPQLRYVPPGACELPTHSQASDPLGKGLHPPGPPKALDLLHQVSQHYTTHKIHELQEHALMSPTPPTSTPVSSTTPSTSSSMVSSKSSSSETSVAKGDAGSTRDSSRSPPTQRHLHTHHHTHVGVGYPIYDPYGAIIASPAPAVDVKPIHPLHQVKSPTAGRYWQ